MRLTGLRQAACGGTVTLCGRDITHDSIRARSGAGMSHIPEDRHKHGLVLDYTLEQNLVLQRYWNPRFQQPRYDQIRRSRGSMRKSSSGSMTSAPARAL